MRRSPEQLVAQALRDAYADCGEPLPRMVVLVQCISRILAALGPLPHTSEPATAKTEAKPSYPKGHSLSGDVSRGE